MHVLRGVHQHQHRRRDRAAVRVLDGHQLRALPRRVRGRELQDHRREDHPGAVPDVLRGLVQLERRSGAEQRRDGGGRAARADDQRHAAAGGLRHAVVPGHGGQCRVGAETPPPPPLNRAVSQWGPVVKDSPQGPSTTDRQPPTAANRHPLSKTVSVLLCFARVLAVERRLDQEAESVPANVRLCWLHEPFSFFVPCPLQPPPDPPSTAANRQPSTVNRQPPASANICSLLFPWSCVLPMS